MTPRMKLVTVLKKIADGIADTSSQQKAHADALHRLAEALAKADTVPTSNLPKDEAQP